MPVTGCWEVVGQEGLGYTTYLDQPNQEYPYTLIIHNI